MECEKDELQVSFEESRDLFIAFGDRYRQDIILILSHNAHVTVKELAEMLHLSRPATSHHIKILKNAGLLGEQKEGVRTFYYVTMEDAIKKVKDLIIASEDSIAKKHKGLEK